jgi:hypothetical protein
MGSASSVRLISSGKSRCRTFSKQFDPTMVQKFEYLSDSCSCGIANLLFQNESARDSFYRFLFNEDEVKALDDHGRKLVESLRKLEHIRNSVTLDSSIASLSCKTNNDDFILPAKSSCKALMTEATQDECAVNFDNVLEITDQYVKLQLLSVFPYFIKSNEYRKWTEHCISTDTSNALGSSKDCYENDTRTQRIQIFSKREKKSKYTDKHRSSLCDAKISFCKIEIDNLSATGIAWLDSILKIVESIPVCFSMATARVDRPGFPLIYVNKAFERVTSYKRAEIIGQNCR